MDIDRTVARTLAARYRAPHIWLVLRTRALALAARATGVDVGALLGPFAWLCTVAPLWVVVRVCKLLSGAAARVASHSERDTDGYAVVVCDGEDEEEAEST
jgi:hypothetical protein